MRVAVRVDAGPRIGGGHAMRCLTLADALSKDGVRVNFATAAMPELLADRISSAGHGLILLPLSGEFQRERTDWHQPPLDADAQQQDVQATEASCGAVDWMIVDQYLLDHRWHSAARRFAGRVMVIDDLANRSYDCDLLLDQTLGRSAADYKGLVPDTAAVLAGAHYALLRPEFSRERPAALRRRREPKSVERILITLGMTDPGSITAAVADAVLGAAPNCAIDVVLTEGAPSLPRVRDLAMQHSGVTIHSDIASDRMADLMRDSDLAIGGAGTSSWERCSLGLPTIALVLAENQRPSAEALALASAVIPVDSPDQIGAAVADLVDDAPQLQQMSAAAFAIIDGRGTERVLQAIRSRPAAAPATIELRDATPDDAELLWLWRNDPITRASSRTNEPIGWTDHVCWLTAALADPDRHLLIGERDGSPVGTVRFDAVHGEPAAFEVSINIRPDARGEGLGRAMLQSACDRFAARHRDCTFRASVREDNEGSRRLFESCGFRSEGADLGWVRYVLAGQHRSAGVQRKLA